MSSSTTKIAVGTGLILLGGAAMMATGTLESVVPSPGLVLPLATLLMAAGALLVGTSEGGQPV
jgi:hypothetical protein